MYNYETEMKDGGREGTWETEREQKEATEREEREDRRRESFMSPLSLKGLAFM